MIKRVLLATMIAAATVGSATIPSVASADVFVRVAPPAPRYEAVPAPRHGYTWAPGYWDWRHNRYHWVGGHWVRERPGYVYYAPSWVEHDGRWHRQDSRWARGDRDHDGIPNRYDHDRDNDGVPNRYDSHPNNPNRH